MTPITLGDLYQRRDRARGLSEVHIKLKAEQKGGGGTRGGATKAAHESSGRASVVALHAGERRESVTVT